MKSICKSLVLSGVLALASTSLYAGEKAGNHPDNTSSQSIKMSSKNDNDSNRWNDSRRVATNTITERPGYFQSSKGERFCTAKAMKDRNNGYTTVARHDSRAWNKDVDASKDRNVNPS